MLSLAAPFARGQMTGVPSDVTEPPDEPSDAWITTKVKAALLTAEGVPATSVHVDTVDGLVTLHGSVGTATEKAKAENIARSVQGMKELRNLLQVVPSHAKTAVAVSDEALAKTVTEALARDPALADSSIAVLSVNKGVILLTGSAKTISDHLRALEDVSAVPGVKQVASQIKSPDAFVDGELWHDGSYDLDLSKRSSASDLWITHEVKVRLLAANHTPVYDINVDTRRGDVTLFGVVDSKREKADVMAETRKVPGVVKVVDALQIVPPGKEAATAESDQGIQDALAKRIGAKRALADAHIVFDVKNGIARLTGDVASQGDRLMALTVTRATPGVRGLVDELRVEPPKVGAR
jgi:osmotically-inducible protein OsmY